MTYKIWLIWFLVQTPFNQVKIAETLSCNIDVRGYEVSERENEELTMAAEDAADY